MHLAEVSSSDNLINRHPSKLLRSVPVENERCGSGRTKKFSVLQYKRHSSGPVSQLTISLKDTNGKSLNFGHLSAMLHNRTGLRGWRWERHKMPWVALADLDGVEGLDRRKRRERLALRFPVV